MYQLDTNINTANERQADRVRAVQSYGSRQGNGQAAPFLKADGIGPTGSVVSKAAVALAAAAPIVLLAVWGLMAH